MPPHGCETSLLPDTSRPETLTNEASSMSSPTICEDTRNVISSPASAAGPTLSGSQDGQTTDLSGPAPVPASRSRSRAGNAVSTTSVTSGLSGTNSSRSDDLQRSLASRLLPLLNGSDLCEVTWKRWDTPWGQCLSRPRARVRTTFETDIGSWPTPTTRDHKDGSYCPNVPVNGLLGRMVWATWVSPTAEDHRRGNKPPRSHDTGVPLSQQVVIADTNGSSVPTENRGALNPEFVCWLMGYPQEWVNCAPSEMPSTRGQRQRSSKQPAR